MEKPYRLPDGGGLFLLVTPAGGKLWRWKYRFEGAEKLMPLGKYPEVPLAQARERHVAARALLANGIDPMAKRKTDKTAKLAQTEGSFQNIASLWLEHWKQGTSPRHYESTQRRMEKDTQDDKTTYQAGVSLVFNGNLTGLGIGPDLGTLSAGFNFSGSWDDSVETDSNNQSTKTTAVSDQQVKSFKLNNTPAVNQPSLNDITYSSEPFWNDEILALVNAHYAVWDYPASPILQPLGNAGAIELTIRALDHCINTPSAIEPISLTPSDWSANSALPVGTFVVELSSAGDPIGAQVVTTAGTTGLSLPNWSTTNGASTADGSVVWTNESAHLYQKPGLSTLTYVWLDSPGCSAIANLDAFYAKKSQTAFPGDYDLISSIDVLTGKPNSWTNAQDSTTTTTQSNTVTLTSKTTSAGQNSQGVSLNLSNFLTALGLNFSTNSTSTATTVFTGQSSATLQNQTFYTGGEAETTTIHDLYSENLAVNVVQDLIFDGIAVQVPSMTFTQTTGAAVAGLFAEQKVNDSHPSQDEPAWAGSVAPKPLPRLILQSWLKPASKPHRTILKEKSLSLIRVL